MEVNISQHTAILIAQILFMGSAVVQLFYFAYFYKRLAFFKETKPSTETPPVSIIIAARNEYENLLQNLPAILGQGYPEFEVIVVLDQTRDESPDLIHALKMEYANLKSVVIRENDRFDGGKKLAITLGIKAAKYNRLLFTDADCRPVGKRWVESMVTRSDGANDVVIGYSPYKRARGLLNAVIRFDNLLAGMNYLSFALARMPYMGVGRNLSYTKEKFFENGGFKSHYSLKSGDDDLFVSEIAEKVPVCVCIDKEASIETRAETTWKAYIRQKRRHFTTGWKYKWHHRLLLILFPLSLAVFWISGISLIVFHTWLYIVLSLIGVRMLLQIFTFSRSSQWLGHSDLIVLAPILEVIVLILSGLIHIANISAKQTTWRS
ncbi:MAG: glycosyltransferase [Cryomorphaceae bacterium]